MITSQVYCFFLTHSVHITLYRTFNVVDVARITTTTHLREIAFASYVAVVNIVSCGVNGAV